MNLEGAMQRCSAVRAAYTESKAAGQLAETRLWRDVLTSADWDESAPILVVVRACEQRLRGALGRTSSLLERICYA